MKLVGLVFILFAGLPVVACHGGSSPTGPQSNLAGTYFLRTTESCGGSLSQIVRVTQTGDQIGFLFGVDTGGVQGTVHGSAIELTWEEGFVVGPCRVRATGTATIAGSVISGSVSGGAVSPGCACVSETIRFTLVKQ